MIRRARRSLDRSDTEKHEIEVLGHFKHAFQAAALDQGGLRFDTVDHRGGWDEITITLEQLGKLPGKFRRVEPARLADAAQQRNDRKILERPRFEIGQCVEQRSPPADADAHAVADYTGKIIASCRSYRRNRIIVRMGKWRNDHLVEAELLFDLSFQRDEIRKIALNSDLDLIASPRFGQHAHDRHTSDTKDLGNLVLSHLLDIVHPGGAHAHPADLRVRLPYLQRCFLEAIRRTIRSLASIGQSSPL